MSKIPYSTAKFFSLVSISGKQLVSEAESPLLFSFFSLRFVFIYSWETHTEREAEREAGSPQGSQCGTRSQDSRITPWAEGRCSTAEPPRHPNKLILKFIWRGKWPRIGKTTLKEKDKVGGLTLFDFKICSITIVIKTMWYLWNNRQIDEWNRIESSEIDPDR